MIKEAYCSKEVSRLLSQKGFDIPIRTYYEDNSNNDNEVIFGDKYNWNNSPIGQISAPTHQIAMAWLREVHKLHIAIERSHKGYHIAIETIPLGVIKYITREITGTTYIDSPEDGVDVALKFCLEKLDLNNYESK